MLVSGRVSFEMPKMNMFFFQMPMGSISPTITHVTCGSPAPFPQKKKMIFTKNPSLAIVRLGSWFWVVKGTFSHMRHACCRPFLGKPGWVQMLEGFLFHAVKGTKRYFRYRTKAQTQMGYVLVTRMLDIFGKVLTKLIYKSAGHTEVT